jgi:hypothetical protein
MGYPANLVEVILVTAVHDATLCPYGPRFEIKHLSRNGRPTSPRRARPKPETRRHCHPCPQPPHLRHRTHRQIQATLPHCWPVTRIKIAAERVQAANAALAAMRAAGTDPTNTPRAAAKRSASLSARKREELAWQSDEEDSSWTRDRYERELLPALGAVPLSSIKQATGLSIPACSRIRSGNLIPHRRHWQPLFSLLRP